MLRPSVLWLKLQNTTRLMSSNARFISTLKRYFLKLNLTWYLYVLYFKTRVYVFREKLTTSYTCAPCETPLVGYTVGQLLQRSTELYADREAVVFIHQNIRKTFQQLLQEVYYKCVFTFI